MHYFKEAWQNNNVTTMFLIPTYVYNLPLLFDDVNLQGIKVMLYEA